MTAAAPLPGREVAAPLVLIDVHLLWQADPDPADLVVRDRWGEIVGGTDVGMDVLPPGLPIPAVPESAKAVRLPTTDSGTPSLDAHKATTVTGVR